MNIKVTKGVIRRKRDRKIVGTWRVVSGSRLLNSLDDPHLKEVILILYQRGVYNPEDGYIPYTSATLTEIASHLSLQGYELLPEDPKTVRTPLPLKTTAPIYPFYTHGGLIINNNAQSVGYWFVSKEGVHLFTNSHPESPQALSYLTSHIQVVKQKKSTTDTVVTVPPPYTPSDLNSNINNTRYFLITWDAVKATKNDWKGGK